MHGTLRFLLSILVALSHLGVSLPNFNQGVSAVVVFYLLAGMVSYKLITLYYQDAPLLYYKNRIKRIFPFYIFTLIVTIIVYSIGINSGFVSKEPSLYDWFSNIVVIPLSYYMYNGIDKFTLIPPAWSLAVELQFYILAPLIFASKKLFNTFLFGSFFIFIMASIGVINTDYYGYRLLVGIIFIFLLGSLIYRARQKDKNALKIIKIIYTLIIFLAIFVLYTNYKVPYNYEVITALIIGIPLLYYFNLKIAKSIDNYLGNLSYGIFLLHFPSLWISQLYFPQEINLAIVFVIVLLLFLIGNIMLNKLRLNNLSR